MHIRCIELRTLHSLIILSSGIVCLTHAERLKMLPTILAPLEAHKSGRAAAKRDETQYNKLPINVPFISTEGTAGCT
jgi:hypothetical protein